MTKLIVVADPMQEVKIFELDETKNISRCISQLRLPQDSVEFIKNYSESLQKLQKPTEVEFRGPADYVQYFISQANQFEFVKAYQGRYND